METKPKIPRGRTGNKPAPWKTKVVRVPLGILEQVKKLSEEHKAECWKQHSEANV